MAEHTKNQVKPHAPISYEKHAQELQEMIDSMVDVMSAAIDALTPYNGNHTRSMCLYGKNFLDWMNEKLASSKTPEETEFLLKKGFKPTSDEEIHRFLMAVRLHDVGKLVTPLPVMNKKTRLGGYDVRVSERFKLIGALDRIAFLEGKLGESIYLERKEELEKAKAFVKEVDKVGKLPKGALEYIEKLSNLTYIDEGGEELPWLDPYEVKKLSIGKGTLTAEERKTMEKHVKYTAELLAEMKFPEADFEVPLWAVDHHELLDGSGYPKKKSGDEIDWHVRLLTILDVYDALTARDRPYKSPTNNEKALEILRDMAEEGKVDSNLVELFCESKAWENKL